ncbi:response regulator [Swingsia samuiensis]|nr:response regulator [Swingsia samuiensis]
MAEKGVIFNNEPSQGLDSLSTFSNKVKRKILIVEDQPLLRFLAADLFEEAGFEPFLAETADEAVEFLDKGEMVDLVFTDVGVPGNFNGWDLAQKVSKKWPTIGIILTTGYGLHHEMKEGAPKLAFVPKPYEWENLYQVIEKLC